MKEKGFTLIELLAVIVVLAIIALIATPLVMNTIKNVRKGSAERSADVYIKRVETMVMEERAKGTVVADGLYLVNEEGNLCKEADTVECTDPYLVEMKGQKPDVGSTIAIENGRVVASLTSSSTSKTSISTKDEAYTIEFNNDGKLVVIDGNVPNKVYMVYQDGYEVYYDVDTGKSCNNYHEDNSLTGYNGTNGSKTTNNQNGCLKFYAFNDNSASSTVNLLLDHNTTAAIAWNSNVRWANDEEQGPLTLLARLHADTDSWNGTVTPKPDTYGYTSETGTKYDSNWNVVGTGYSYNIDYSGYKARLISIDEIAQITGYEDWDDDYYYFDTNDEDGMFDGKAYVGEGKYGWLYDRTREDCELYGCLNNDSGMSGKWGYWTSSASSSAAPYAWYVDYSGSVVSTLYVHNAGDSGLRPVITVSKSKFQE